MKPRKKGIPIGNLTSQLFANIYMNEFDQFMKHTMKVKYYARYTDDFVIISNKIEKLEQLVSQIGHFLHRCLKLSLHPNKVFIQPHNRGVDFLGQIIFPHYKLLRTKTRKRIFKKIKLKVGQYNDNLISESTLNQSLQSYLGVLSHTNSYKQSEKLKNQFWFWYTKD